MEILWDNEAVLPDGCLELLTGLIRRGLAYTHAPEASEISVSFVDSEEIKELNALYRNIDSPTDVLSFPFYEAGTVPASENGGFPVALGDIVICPEIAKAQADEYGHTYERELSFLIVHGFLHLMGYDHIEQDDEQKMRQAQRDILNV